MSFNLGEAYSAFLKDPEELIEGGGLDEISEDSLESLIDELANTPEAIVEPDTFNVAKSFCHSLNNLSDPSREKLIDLLAMGVKTQNSNIKSCIAEGENTLLESQKAVLEHYAFLTQWFLTGLESHQLSISHVDSATASSRKRVVLSGEFKSAMNLSIIALDSIIDILECTYDDVIFTSSERDIFMGMLVRPVLKLLENEVPVSVSDFRMRIFKILCQAIKLHHQQNSIQTSLMQFLNYYEHLSEPLAELLQILYEQYDSVLLSEEIIMELSDTRFNANDNKGPKQISMFLMRLSVLVPEVVMKQMVSISKLLESESYTLRCAIVDVIGNITVYIARQDDFGERQQAQLKGLLNLVEERILDINPYCRCRALQVFSSVCEIDTSLVKHRPDIVGVAVSCMQDRSTLVRRNAIKFLSKLIVAHPFGLLHGSQLNFDEWNQRLEVVTTELNGIIEREVGSSELLPQTEQLSENQEASTSQTDISAVAPLDDNVLVIEKLRLTQKYYADAVGFILKIDEALAFANSLLFSKNKNEIVDSMDLLVLADAFGIKSARAGIRRMVHLVWAKANNDEGNSIQEHLLQCYKNLYLETPPDATEEEAASLVARNLMSLTYGATLAELTSLERLIGLAMEKPDMIPTDVVKMLWKVYVHQSNEVAKLQRRGSIIILGMMAKADPSISIKGLSYMIQIGLGELGHSDSGLVKYTCIALQRCAGLRPDKSRYKLPSDHEVFGHLSAVLKARPKDMEWFGVAEQATKAINDLCATPDLVFTEVIKYKVHEIFGDKSKKSYSISDENSLSALLFLVGDVALKTLVHLESCELQFKRAKADTEKNNVAANDNDDNDIDMIGGGTSEDDFTDQLMYIRERELLYGEHSLLRAFGKLVSDICRDGLSSKRNEMLCVASSLCLAKFMAVSSIYCDSNLPILLKLLEVSDNPVVRSNSVLALGDITVCFNHLMDQNSNALYQRLHDNYPVVQRTCLMTLTFLILAGQVKVKGQIGEMAKCIEDPDERISQLSRMFFTELATKENSIYNGFIDMFSVLSADSELSPESFNKIIKFLVSFIDKEKQIKQLSQKLYTRLGQCQTEKAWNDVAFVLQQLPHKNDEISHGISEGFKFGTEKMA